MTKELNILDVSQLNDISEKDVNTIITKIMKDNKKNMERICELTLECTSLIKSAESRSISLGEQKLFKRIIASVTGNNRNLKAAILQDQTNALYVAQSIINRVMAECNNNRKLFIAINDKVNDHYLELKERENELAKDILNLRDGFKKVQEQTIKEIHRQKKRISKLEQFAKKRCPNCQKELLDWQRVCSYCGEIHSLKTENLSKETMDKLEKLSKIIKEKADVEEITLNCTPCQGHFELM